MKVFKKFIKNKMDYNKFSKLFFTFCLCFILTLLLTLVFNNKFKLLEKLDTKHDF